MATNTTTNKMKNPEENEEVSINMNLGLERNEFDKKPSNVSCQSPEISKFSPSPNKPPKYPTPDSPLTRRRTFKSKTRFGEPSLPLDSQTLEMFEHSSSFAVNTVKDKDGKDKKDGPDEKEIYQRVTSQLTARNRKKMTVKFLVEFTVFLLILGMLITQWFVHLIVFLIEWKFLLKKNVVYFTHGLQNNVVVFIWIGVVLGTWCMLLKPDVRKTHKAKSVLDFITWTLITLLIGSFLWLVKTTLMKTLSGRPVVELSRKLSKQESSGGLVSFTENTGSQKEKKVVDWAKLHQMKQEKVPSWTMKLLVDVVSNSGLSTMSGILNEDVVEGGVQLDDNEITSEEAAIATAVRIFYNVIGDKIELYIDRCDLHRFMIWEEVSLVYQFFEANEKGHIDLKAFCNWVVRVYKDRQALKHALNDNKTAVDELNKIAIGILIVMMIILWLLLTELASTKLLLFFSSQLVVAAFIFGNTCKTIFEAIIFVFVMHPFDVSDRCVIDGTMMIVEEMNILTTVFLKADNEKVYYPNSVLSTKPISNFYRSPDQGDSLEFGIDYRTPLPKIAQLKERIKQYIDKNPHIWHPTHNLVVKEIENINKIKMALFFNHTMNFQDYPEKSRRRTELVLEMKTIFDSLEITYNLLPQEVLLSNIPING
ncbi:hypothetical protein KSS87_019345 [Heliosperma pusillum]|nr:hypothetical protein KSS87_019345 [Heliosperma pusillum]